MEKAILNLPIHSELFYLNGKEVEVVESLQDGSYLVQMNDNIQFLAYRKDFYIIGKDISKNAIPHLSYDKLTDSDRRLIGFHLMFHSLNSHDPRHFMAVNNLVRISLN